MAFSNVSYTGDGSTAAFSVPFPYLFQTDVAVTVNGATPTFVWTNPALITITPAPVSGSQVLIKRTTEVSTLEVVFEDGSTVQASDINTDGLQMLYLAQEQQDGIAGVVAAGAAATAAAAAATAAAAAAAAAAVPMVGDSGSGGTAGLVPAPPAGSFAAKKFLSAGGSWLTTSGTPASMVFFDSVGGVPDGTTDNSAALNAALAAFGNNSGVIIFGAGVYKFNSRITFAYPATGTALQSISFIGSGQDVTHLLWPSTSGMSITLAFAGHTFHFSDLSIETAATPASSLFGLQVVQTAPGGGYHQNTITRVTVGPNTYGASATAWSTGIALIGTSNVALDTCSFFGAGPGANTGLIINGISTASFQFSLGTTLTNCLFLECGTGINLLTYWQGVIIHGCNFILGGGNIVVNAGDPSQNLSQLQISDCAFTTGVGATCVTIGSAVNCLQITNSLFPVVNSHFGIWLVASGGGTITGNIFSAGQASPAGNIGINVGPLASFAPFPMTITGNSFSGIAAGINLGVSSAHVNVQSNAYLNVATTTVNNGTGNTLGGGST